MKKYSICITRPVGNNIINKWCTHFTVDSASKRSSADLASASAGIRSSTSTDTLLVVKSKLAGAESTRSSEGPNFTGALISFSVPVSSGRS